MDWSFMFDEIDGLLTAGFIGQDGLLDEDEEDDEEEEDEFDLGLF